MCMCMWGVWFAGCVPAGRPTAESLTQAIEKQLIEEPSDSDAAVILSQALTDALLAGADRQAQVLDEAMTRARQAREFSPVLEAPLPEGWPRPSLPGLIRIKTYPAVRAAWVREPRGNNRLFSILFNHIKSRDIAMTGPVVMGYPVKGSGEFAEAPDSMAFLYRRLDQDQAGRFGQVVVEDEKPLRVVSVGLMGSYRERNFQEAAEGLRDWLKTHREWKADGPVRVLAYNSPFMLFWRKYSEVQIPVCPVKP